MAVLGRSSGNSQAIAFGNIASSLRDVAFQFTAVTSAAQALYGTLNVFRELEKQLTLTNAIAGGNAESFKAMEKAVRDFSLGVTFTASESANALLQLSQAGFNTTEAIQAMTGVLTLASATLEDVNETADLVASTLTSFGLQAGDATEVSNLFAASMNQSLASLPKLAFALRQVGPVAGSMGVSLEETTAALSELFNVGLRGEQAGTALRNVLVNLVSPAGEAAKVLKTLGLNIYQTDGRMRDLFDILKDLAKYKLSDTDLAALFGREALAGGTALLNSAASGSLDEMRKNISGTQDAVRVALEQMNSFDAQLKLARNGIDEFRISVGQGLAEQIKPLLGYITDLAIAFRELDEPTRKYILTLGELGAGALVAVPIFSKLFGVIKSLFGTFIGAAASFAGSARNVATALGMIGSFADILPALGLAAGAATPLLLGLAAAVAGVGGLVYAFRSARDAYDKARFDEIFGEFEGAAPNIQRQFQNFSQMNKANEGNLDYLKGITAVSDAAGAVIAKEKGNLKRLTGQANELAKLRNDMLGALRNGIDADSFGDAVAKDAEFQKNAIDMFGAGPGSSPEEINRAVQKQIDDRIKSITDLMDKVSPEMGKKFQDAIGKKLKESQDEIARAGRNLSIPGGAPIARNIVVDLFKQVLEDQFGGDSDLSGFQSEFDNRIKEIEDDVATANKTIKDRMSEVRNKDLDPLIADLQKSLVAGLSDAKAKPILRDLQGATSLNDAFLEYVRNALYQSVEDKNFDLSKFLGDLPNVYKQRLEEAMPGISTNIAAQLAEENKKATALLLSDTVDKIRKQARDAEKALLTSQRSEAAAKGDKTAEKALREQEETQKFINKIQQNAAQLSEGFERLFQNNNRKGITPEMVGLFTGSTIADMLEQGGDQKDRVINALKSYEDYQNFIRDQFQTLAEKANFEDVLKQVGLNVPEIDPDKLFAASKELIDLGSEGAVTAEAAKSAMDSLITYFEANNEQAIAVIRAAGIPIETLNAADVPQVAAGALMSKFGQQVLNALATLDIGGKMADAFNNAQGLVDGTVAAAKSLIGSMGDALKILGSNSFANIKAEADQSVADAKATTDAALKNSKAQYEALRNNYESSLSNISGGNARTDKRKSGGGGGKGKSKEEVQAELEKFLAERNEKIIEANIQLAAYGEDVDINEIVGLKRDKLIAEMDSNIADVKQAYQKMFDQLKKAGQDTTDLTAQRDRELEQLEKLKQANLDYANSAEFAAQAAKEAGQDILDKYIQLHEQTGTFLQGLAAGAQQYILDMKSNFQTGMDTIQELIGGVTSFGKSMFNDYFTQVATGQKKFSEVLRENLSKMLLNWGNYFAELAMKYLADWVLKKTLGLFGGLGGGLGGGQMGIAMGGGVGLYAKGGAFDGVTPFANGGVTSGAQYFGYRKETKIGVHSEAGEEAVMPLTRDTKGRLSVIAVNPKDKQSSDAPGVYTYTSHNTFDLRGNNALSEEDSAQLQSRMDERTKEAARQVIAEEMRQGGILNKYGR